MQENTKTFENISIVFQDIDGCLNTSCGKSLPVGGQVYTHGQNDMLREIGQAMNLSKVPHIVLCTGRNLHNTLSIYKKLQSEKIRFLIFEHGALGYDLLHKMPLQFYRLAKNISPQSIFPVFKTLKSIEKVIFWYKNSGQALCEEKLKVPLSPYPKEASLTLEVPIDLKEKDFQSFFQKELRRILSDEEFKDIHFYFSRHYMDITSLVNKIHGAHLLCQTFGFSLQTSAVIGDSLNDLALFEHLPHRYCPQNAHDRVKKICREKQGVISSLSYGEATLQFYQGFS